MDEADGVSHDHVAGGILRDGKRLEDGNAGSHQRTEGSGEAGDGAFALHIADDRHGQQSGVNLAASVGRLAHGRENSVQDGDYRGQNDGIGHKEGGGHEPVADAEHKLGNTGKFLVLFCEHRLEFGHDDQHQEDHDAYGDKQDDGGIHHGGDHLAFQLFLVFRQTVQHDFQHTAQFPGLYHVDKQAVKNSGVLGQGFREGGAALNGISKSLNGYAQVGVCLLFGQHVQTLEQGKPRINQRSKLAGENHQSLGLDFASQLAFLLLGSLGLFLGGRRLLNLALARFYDLGGVQAMRPDGFHGLRFGIGLQGTCFLVAFMVKCCVLIFRHICCILSVFS